MNRHICRSATVFAEALCGMEGDDGPLCRHAWTRDVSKPIMVSETSNHEAVYTGILSVTWVRNSRSASSRSSRWRVYT